MLAAACGFAIWRVALRAKRGGGCCSEREAAVKKTAVRDRNKAHYPYKAAMEIGGMTCENCARRVENALNSVEGTWASVDISSKTAKVLSKTPIDEGALRSAVRGAGYTVMRTDITS